MEADATKTGRRERRAWGVSVIAGLALAGSAAAGCDRPKPVAQQVAQPTGPQVVAQEADEWFVHPTIGFRIRHPGPSFHRVPALEEEIRKATVASEHYIFQTEEQEARLVIHVSLQKVPDSRSILELAFAGLMEEVRTAGGPQEAPSRIDFEEITNVPPFIARAWATTAASRPRSRCGSCDLRGRSTAMS
jgi:hypothetical protein